MKATVEWFASSAERFVWISLLLNVFYALVFALAGNYPKCIYFLGAAVLTVGLIMMR